MDSPDWRSFTAEAFQDAVATYMRLAYPSGNPPENVSRRLIWPESASIDQLVACPQFERGTVPGTISPVYALRLGNQHYPHMKLQVQPWPTSVGAMLSVNTHDQIVGLDPNSPDAAAFRSLQSTNQQVKEAIEHAWDEQGLPTFLRYLRDYLALPH